MSTEDRTDLAPPVAPPSDEEAAWAEVRAAWSDEAAHRRYLARFSSLEALAVAGQRYKAVLAERPDDDLALLMRAEIVKKATAYAFAAAPRPPTETPKNVRRVRLAVAVAAGAVLVWAAFQLAALIMGARS
jgi:hypothetical protein